MQERLSGNAGLGRARIERRDPIGMRTLHREMDQVATHDSVCITRRHAHGNVANIHGGHTPIIGCYRTGQRPSAGFISSIFHRRIRKSTSSIAGMPMTLA